jgi:exosortase B
MPTHTTSDPTATSSANPRIWELAALALGILVMYVPTYHKLSEQIWSQEGQGHGPVMLALVLWLVWQRWPQFAALPSRPANLLATLLFVPGLALYAFGRSMDFAEFETASQILVIGALFLYYKGVPGVRLMWFPLFFLVFLIPLPSILVMALTAPLKAGVSYVAEALLYAADYPIGRTGVTLTIGQYRLLVADACAGMNSIFALEAVGVFYMSLMKHTHATRNILLAIFILPISFVSNVIRVVVLVLITYYFGDEAGQGFIHGFAGILLFVIATILTIGLDNVLGWVFGHRQPETSASSR